MTETQLPPPMPINPGAAQSAASSGPDRRVAPEAQRRRDRVRGVVARRVVRERRLGRLLDRELGPVAIVLHQRKAGDGVIDHLVVAASGVWVIDARHDVGKVDRGRDAEHGATACVRARDGRQVEIVVPRGSVDLVGGHLERMGFGWLDVRRVVCLTNADWGVLRQPFESGGALVTWGRALVDRIGVPGPLAPVDMRAVAVELNTRLPTTR